jgi:hypothetical protein
VLAIERGIDAHGMQEDVAAPQQHAVPAAARPLAAITAQVQAVAGLHGSRRQPVHPEDAGLVGVPDGADAARILHHQVPDRVAGQGGQEGEILALPQREACHHLGGLLGQIDAVVKARGLIGGHHAGTGNQEEDCGQGQCRGHGDRGSSRPERFSAGGLHGTPRVRCRRHGSSGIPSCWIEI